MAQTRPTLWMPGLGAGRRRRRPGCRGGASHQLQSCFLRPSPRVLSRGRLAKTQDSVRDWALGARPRLRRPAGRDRPLSRLGRHLPGLEATSSSGQTLPSVSPQDRPDAAQLLQRLQPAERGRAARGGGDAARRGDRKSVV